jgi:hypothetical protein
MHSALSLALALALLSGAACAQDGSSTPTGMPGAAADDRAEPAATEGSSEPSAPATQESQGLSLDNVSRTPAPSARGGGASQDCTNQGAAASASGPGAAVDCGPGQTRTPRR